MELIRRAQGGDRSAFGALFDAYYPCVYRYLRDRLGGAPEAEDLCQEVFLTVLGSIDEYPCGADMAFDEWLLRVAHRLATEHHRNSVQPRQRRKLEPAVPAPARLNPVAIELLSEQQRQIVAYRFNAGLSARPDRRGTAVGSVNGAADRTRRAGNLAAVRPGCRRHARPQLGC
ncbi:MAG TPA: sigma factor [Dehalococcoidia bacterium]